MTGGAGAGAAPAAPAHGSAFFITALGIGQICSLGIALLQRPLLADAMGRELGWFKLELQTAATAGLWTAAVLSRRSDVTGRDLNA